MKAMGKNVVVVFPHTEKIAQYNFKLKVS